MIVRTFVRTIGACAIVCLAFAGSAQAQQQQPTAAAIALATQLLELKGGITAFDPAVDGVVTHHKGLFSQMNPNAGRALDDVEKSIRAEANAKKQELHVEVARGYASAFTEQDLKDLLAFYKSPLGQKVIEGEPKAGEAAARAVQAWVDKYADTVANRMRAELRRKGFTEF